MGDILFPLGYLSDITKGYTVVCVIHLKGEPFQEQLLCERLIRFECSALPPCITLYFVSLAIPMVDNSMCC